MTLLEGINGPEDLKGLSQDQLTRLARFLEQTGRRPVIDRVLPLSAARDGFAAMTKGDLFGKIVFIP